MRAGGTVTCCNARLSGYPGSSPPTKTKGEHSRSNKLLMGPSSDEAAGRLPPVGAHCQGCDGVVLLRWTTCEVSIVTGTMSAYTYMQNGA